MFLRRNDAFDIISRLLAMATGAYALYRLALDIEIFNKGPSGYVNRLGTAFSSDDPNPAWGFLLSLLVLIPSFAGMVLVWFRPRSGLLIAAAGWALVTIVPIVHLSAFVGREDKPLLWNWRVIAFIGIPILLLLISASMVKVATKPARISRPE